jgi:galactokinase/mevalonate kinase-like predicted kinase
MVNDGWKIKKSLSKKIIENSRIIEMDTILEADREILAHRLLGAGDGGYFLFFTRKNVPIQNLENKLGIKILKIDVCNEGISGHVI